MGKYFYKVVKDATLEKKLNEAKRFFMKDLGITKRVDLYLIEMANNNPFHKMDYMIDRSNLDHIITPSGIHTKYEILGEMHGSKRAIFINKDQTIPEMIRTVAHETRHILDYDQHKFGPNKPSNATHELAAEAYELVGLQKYDRWHQEYKEDYYDSYLDSEEHAANVKWMLDSLKNWG